MIPGSFRRVVVVVAAIAIALTAGACSDTSSTDAASATFKDTSGTHTVHVPTSTLIEQVSQLSSSTALMSALQQNGLQPPASTETANPQLTAQWLTLLLRQAVYDQEFDAQHLKLTDTDRQLAEK
jgi:hypothetical protein